MQTPSPPKNKTKITESKILSDWELEKRKAQSSQKGRELARILIEIDSKFNDVLDNFRFHAEANTAP